LIRVNSKEKKMTVADLLKELNMEGKYFGIHVDGKKANPDTAITPESEIVVLPHIAGGRAKIDRSIIDYIKQINNLGWKTVQCSCSGMKKDHDDKPHKTQIRFKWPKEFKDHLKNGAPSSQNFSWMRLRDKLKNALEDIGWKYNMGNSISGTISVYLDISLSDQEKENKIKLLIIVLKELMIRTRN